MDFPFGQKLVRDRRERVADDYEPERTVAGEFDPSLTVELPDGWYVASSSSVSTRNLNRVQTLTSKSAYGPPGADILPGDRIRVGGTVDDLESGTAYLVDAVPEADTNPFTGWSPVQEVPLTAILEEG